MTSTSGLEEQIKRSLGVVSGMLEEFRYDEAALFLFNLRSLHPLEWKEVTQLLISTVDASKFQIVATVIDCSSRSDLSACNALIPGLSQYTRIDTNPDFFD